MTRSRPRRTAAALLAGFVASVAFATASIAVATPASAAGGDTGNDGPLARLLIHGGTTIVTSDTTPTISGRAAPAGKAITVSITGAISGTADDGTRYRDVPCASSGSTERGAWSCTVSTPLHGGTYTLAIHETVTTPSGVTRMADATVKVRVEAGGPPAAPPPTGPKTEPPATGGPTKPATTVAGKPAAAPTTKAPVIVVDPEPEALEWAFRVLDEDGNDITGRPVEPGDRIVITSTGLPVGARVSLALHSVPRALGTATAGTDGALSLAAMIPSDAEPGQHALVATLTAPGYSPSVAQVQVEVDEPIVLDGTLSAGPVDPVEPVDTPVAPVEDVDKRGFDDGHSGIADSLPTIHDITPAPWKFAATGGLAAALVLLAALPAELLQSTLSENYGRAFRWLEPARRRVSRVHIPRPGILSNPWVGGTFAVAVAALILGFAEPDVGLNMASLRTFIALFLSLFLLNIAVGAIKLSAARTRLNLPGQLIPMPGALAVAAVSVLVSRFMDLNPSLLFGLVVGVAFARVESRRTEGRLALLAISSVLALGLGAWVWFSVIVDLAGETQSFGVALLEETLAATALECLSVLVVAMLPFRFLEGKHIHDWDRRIWAAMYLLCASVFIFIAVPLGESWEESNEPVGTWLAICAGFGIIAVSAWAAFRFIPSREPQDKRELEDARA